MFVFWGLLLSWLIHLVKQIFLFRQDLSTLLLICIGVESSDGIEPRFSKADSSASLRS